MFFYQPNSFVFNDLEIGKISSKDIIAPKTITYIDEEATEEAKQVILNSTESVYDEDSSIPENIISEVQTFYDSLIKAKRDKEKKYNNSTDDDKKEKDKAYEVDNNFELSKDTINEILELPESNITNFFNYIKNDLKNLYETGVTEERLEAGKKLMASDSNLFLFPSPLRERTFEAIVNSLKPNLILNVSETDKKVKESLEEFEPIYKKVTKGEAIIRKHEEINEGHIEKLEHLGMLERGFNFKEFLKFLPLTLFAGLLLMFYYIKFLLDNRYGIRAYITVSALISLVVLLSQILQNTLWHMMPLLTFYIILSVFFPRHFLLLTAIILSTLINFGDIYVSILTLVSGVALSVFYGKFKTFIDAIKNGVLLGLVVSVLSVILVYTFEERFVVDMLITYVLSGVFAGIIANGLIPLLEKIFGVTTVFKLTELNSYDHPLLEELYNKAKGTYDHSRNVAHLCSVAAKKIGVDSLLLRVAALYHDVGKMEDPEYYIENSNPSDNIHDKMSPKESAKIILSHPVKSVSICKKHRIPKEVTDIILKHHGDSILEHFYNKELNVNGEANESDFRYNAPPPETKEETILLLADISEAVSRLVKTKDHKVLKNKLLGIFESKMKDGTLRKSQLTLNEMNICADEFAKAILSSNHERIEYTKKEK